MVDVRIVKKYNPRTKGLEPEEHPFDTGPLFTVRKQAESSGELVLGEFKCPNEVIAIITGVKYASTVDNTWFKFEFSGVKEYYAKEDYCYLVSAGEGMLVGSPDNPVWTLEEGNKVKIVVMNANENEIYAITIYGRYRSKVFKGLTP